MPSMKNIRQVSAIPHAASLIEGLRDFGYSLETALADIIDNSITAGATRVSIEADTTSENPWVAIVDNGHGMSEDELVEAMRPGTKNPLNQRDASDLGRFGLGLKSASFSQCRNLMVLTRKEGVQACASWDLDEVSRHNTWQIDLHDEPDLPELDIPKGSGTVVIWRNLDRLHGGYTQNLAERAKVMNAAISQAERHLRLVFHRFLEGTKPRVELKLNGRQLKEIDPFASKNNATQKDPPDYVELAKGTVKIKCYTLPHHKKMTEVEWKEIAGPEGHLKSQGLYVYRADRLIIAGGWLGLTAQTELTKLCRVSVEIPNTMDGDWKIDVKKASAQLPPLVRKRLRIVIERFVSTSKRTYQRRGKKLVDRDQSPIWSRVQKDENIIFKPNIDHPVFKNFSERLSTNLATEFRNCITLIGASLPIESLHADLMGSAETVVADSVEREALHQQVAALVKDLIEKGVPPQNISDTLHYVDMLKMHWSDVSTMIEDILLEMQR